MAHRRREKHPGFSFLLLFHLPQCLEGAWETSCRAGPATQDRAEMDPGAFAQAPGTARHRVPSSVAKWFLFISFILLK